MNVSTGRMSPPCARHRLAGMTDECLCPAPPTEQERAEREYPHHHPVAALANYRAGREQWDTNGDLW